MAVEIEGVRREQSDERGGDDEPRRRPLYKRPGFVIGGLVVLVVLLIVGIGYYLHARSHESTDDAFIESNVVQISPKVSGIVRKVYVTDNQAVKAGDLLLELDARDYEAQLAQAKAGLEAAERRQNGREASLNLMRVTTRADVQQARSEVASARANVQSLRAQAEARHSGVAQAEAQVTQAQAAAHQAEAGVTAAAAVAARDAADVKRYEELYAKDEVSRQRLDQAVAAARASAAQLEAARRRADAAQAQVTQAQAARRAAEQTYRQALAQVNSGQGQIGTALGRLAEASARPQRIEVSRTEVATAGADIAAARAALQQAELNLSYTKIYAPESGRVTRKNVDEGQLLQPGQVVMAIVYGEVWVVANFKETQLREMRVGQPVEIKVDAYPDRHFKGHVDSFQYGTGARFSLLPPENATGNFVKVVQRVPVKIVFDEQPDLQHPLVPGMSVEPEVNVGAKPTPPNRGQPKGASPGPQASASPGSPLTPSARPPD